MGPLSSLPTLPHRGSFLSSVRARRALALVVFVLLPLWEAWKLSACFLCSLFPSHRCWEASSGLAGRWELAFFPHVDQSTAEVSKWQPHPCGASLPAHPCFRKDSLAAQANPLLSCCSRSRPLLALKEGIGLGTEMFRL